MNEATKTVPKAEPALDPLRNPKDPLRKASNEAGVELFRKLSAQCDGFSTEAVIVGAMNLLINAVRTAHASRSGAERAFDEYTGKAKYVLLDQHYDYLGRRRSVFPYTQVIEIPKINLKGGR
jgi:hypothetical protein